MTPLHRDDPGYPRRLRPNGPDPLWVSGRLPPDEVPTVGIVGTRRLTPYGARVARDVASAVAAAGAVVVSGLAQGIDSAAHAAAIAAGGRTIAVLGEGLAAFDAHGPLRRRALARSIQGHGAVVSEYALDVSAKDWTFPRRNATIAALSEALVVIEAPLRSGALITAKRAADIGRPVWAVPGVLAAPTWAGSNALITAGDARMLTDPAALIAELGLAASGASRPLADPLLDLLAAGAADADAIAAALRIRPREVSALVAHHLLAGTVIATADGRFARA